MTVISNFRKEISILFLLLICIGMDYFKISDPALRYTVMGMIGALTGHAGVMSWVNRGATPTPAVTPKATGPAVVEEPKLPPQ
jgi:hypothetical protein